MQLDPTDEEAAALLCPLNRAIEDDRHPLSPRIRTLRDIRAKLPAAAPEPPSTGHRRHPEVTQDARRGDRGEWIRGFGIITTTPNELCAQFHNRMPVVLKPESWLAWLGKEPADPSELKALLAPFPSEEMTCWPVSARVGNVKNNDPSLIDPMA
jgi:hypothetical protein